MQKKVFLNIKSFLTIPEQQEYFKKLNTINSKNIVVFVPSISYYLSNDNYNFSFGAQSFSYLPMGPYTNSISLDQITYFSKIKYCLVNHNDEIKYFSHDDNKLFKQLELLKDKDMVSLLCFSEKNESLSTDEKVEALSQQLFSLIENLDLDEQKIIFSYEPKNLINSSIAVDVNEINIIIKNLKDRIKDKYNKSFKFAFGGNINKNNFSTIYQADAIDALLIGRFSLDVENLKECIESNEK